MGGKCGRGEDAVVASGGQQCRERLALEGGRDNSKANSRGRDSGAHDEGPR